MNRTIRTASTTTLLAGVLLFGLTGCGSGGGGLIPASGGSRSGKYVGKVTSVMNWRMPDQTFTGLTPATRAALQQKGITVDDNTRTLVSNELPLSGHWVKVGDRYCMTDKDGVFTVDGEVPSGGQALVFSQVDSSSPEGEVPLSSLVPEGQTPNAVRLSLAYGGSPLPGDAAAASRSAQAPDGCAIKEGCLPAGHPEGNKKACCLDYNGASGDGIPRIRSGSSSEDCRSKATDNYINSTCFLWNFSKGSRPCLDENPFGEDKDTACWKNHRYRNCQNMAENDVKAPAKIKVPLGGRVTFTVRNNTEGNATMLTWVEKGVPGSLELEPGVPSSHARLETITSAYNYYFVQHYSEARQEHYEDVTVAYVAPTSLPDGKRTATYHLWSSAGGVNIATEVIIGDEEYIEVTPASDTINVGEQTAFTAQAKDAQGNTLNLDFEWSSSNGAASVDSQGVVTGLADGQSIITVRSPGTDLRATATVTVKALPKPGGRYVLSTVNGAAPPAVVNEYYDERLKRTFRMTIHGGFFDLHNDGTFETEHKGGEGNFPVTLKGSGTYQVNGSKINFTYTSGFGPIQAAIIGTGKIAITSVFEADEKEGGHFPKDVTVTEVYSLK